MQRLGRTPGVLDDPAFATLSRIMYLAEARFAKPCPLKTNAVPAAFFGYTTLPMFYFLLNALIWVSTASPQQSPPSQPIFRPCSDSWNAPEAGTKKNRPKSAKKELKKESGACIELAYSALEIQEYLQSYARKERWKITGDQLNEDSWTFSLDLDKDELLRDTSADSNPKNVEWRAGTARINVNTSELADGFTRTIVRGSFRGFGRNQDQFAMAKEYWNLESNNAFESSITSALRNYFTAAAPVGNP
jgi:hypothetical protein